MLKKISVVLFLMAFIPFDLNSSIAPWFIIQLEDEIHYLIQDPDPFAYQHSPVWHLYSLDNYIGPVIYLEMNLQQFTGDGIINFPNHVTPIDFDIVAETDMPPLIVMALSAVEMIFLVLMGRQLGKLNLPKW